MTEIATLPEELFEPPRQADVIRRMQQPAARSPLPIEASFDAELVALPTPTEAGRVELIAYDREDAVDLILAHREEVVRHYTPSELWFERELCRRDRLYFIGRWLDVSTKFSIGNDRIVPFALFPYQVRGIRLYERARRQRVGIFSDKSRQLGESWRYMALYLHALLFEESIPLFATSRKEEEVDNGGNKSNVKSLFGRIRFMYNRLPDFLRLDPKTHKEALEFKYLSVNNPTTGAFVAGEGATEEIARSGTYEVGLLDEFGRIERSETALASAMAAIRCLIVNSTPEGEANAFARIHKTLTQPRSPKEEALRDRFLVSRIHWSENPIYNRGIRHGPDGKLVSPWYLKETAGLTEETAAAEYDIEYAGSLPGRFFPEFGYSLVSPDVQLRRDAFLYLSADHGLGDTEVWGLWQTDGRTWADLVDEWHSVPEGSKHGADLTTPEVAENLLSWLRGWGLSLWDFEALIADPSGAARDQTSGQSHWQLLRYYWQQNTGRVPPALTPANNEFAAGIASVRVLLRGHWNGNAFRVRVSDRCTFTIDSLLSYRRKIERSTGRVLPDEFKDWTNHAADMVRYFVHSVFPAIGDVVDAGASGESYADMIQAGRR